MSFNIEVTALFEKQFERLVKKFRSLKKEYSELITSLKQNPTQGSSIGNNCYKIRGAISKGKGRSGGVRVITHLQVVKKIYLFLVYDKSEQSDIKDNDLNEWIKPLK